MHKCVLGRRARLRWRNTTSQSPNGTVPRLIEDLKACLRQANYATTGLKADLVQRVRSNFPGIRIYDDIVAAHERAGRKMLKWEMWSRILKASLHISMHPTLARAFQGGRSEISIFWINALGVRCKARLDYLRLVGLEHRGKPILMASVSDLKSFASPQQIPIERAVENAAGSNMAQAVHYLGRRARRDQHDDHGWAESQSSITRPPTAIGSKAGASASVAVSISSSTGAPERHTRLRHGMSQTTG